MHPGATGRAGGRGRGAQHPHAGLGGQRLQGVLAVAGGDQHLDELALEHLPGGVGVERAVEGDDAAEGGRRVGRVGRVVGLRRARGLGRAAGIRVLDDDAGRRGEGVDAFPGRVGVGEVVEREFAALMRDRARERVRAGAGVAVERGALVRILPVAQRPAPVERQAQVAAEARVGVAPGLQMVGDVGVVGGSVRERLGGQLEAQRAVGAAGPRGGQHARVVGRVGHRTAVRVIFGGGAQHRRPPHVDLLDRFLRRAIRPRRDAGERIQVDHQQIDRRDAVFGGGLGIRRAAAEQAAVHQRVQGLDAPAHDLREAGELAHLAHREPGRAQRGGGAAGGDQFRAGRGQAGGQFGEAGLVRDAEQRPAHRDPVGRGQRRRRLNGRGSF